MYEKYKEQNFVIIGFPCNQVRTPYNSLSSNPIVEDSLEAKNQKNAIQEFCTINHGVTFPLMKKSDVNGDNTNEVFKWLKDEKSGLLGLSRIKVRFQTCTK